MSRCYLGFADPLKSQFLFNQNKTLKMEADRVSKFFVVLELESVKNYSNFQGVKPRISAHELKDFLNLLACISSQLRLFRYSNLL